jgi:hypothetical protein
MRRFHPLHNTRCVQCALECIRIHIRPQNYPAMTGVSIAPTTANYLVAYDLRSPAPTWIERGHLDSSRWSATTHPR